MNTFVPVSFSVPSGIETTNFKLRMLTINDLIKDYDAVMTSVDHLKGVFGLESSWPEGVTLEQDLIDLGWHQKEFQLKRSFAYTLMNLDESRCLGCVYIEPSEKADYDARVILWVRQSELGSGFDDQLFATVKKWLSEKWPFTKPAFPGREITWQHWLSLADK